MVNGLHTSTDTDLGMITPYFLAVYLGFGDDEGNIPVRASTEIWRYWPAVNLTWAGAKAVCRQSSWP